MPLDGNKISLAISRALNLLKGIYLRYPQFVVAGAVLGVIGVGGSIFLGVKYMIDASGNPTIGTTSQKGTTLTNNGGAINSSGNSVGKNDSKSSKSRTSGKVGSSSSGTSTSSNSGSSSGSGSSGGSSGGTGSSGGGSSGGGTQTFKSVTGWARPSPASPSAASTAGWRLVPFSTKAGLDSAVSGMQGQDYIYYNGTGVLNISSSSTSAAYSIHDKNPSSPVVFDFGTAHDIWDSSQISGNYVEFAYNGTSNQGAFWLYGDSNLRFYGGYLTSPLGGSTVLLQPSETNTIHDILWYDGYVYDAGGSGIAVRGSTNSTGTASNAYNLDLRFEVNGFSMLPSFDNHCDKGTGFHALILHGNRGAIHDSRFAVYGHDALKPGQVWGGITWPEGGGGSVIEQGNSTAANYDNDTMYALGENNLMVPNGTNPGSTCQQTSGNVFNLWGNIQLNGNIIGWAEGNNITGSIIHSDNGTWFPGSPALVVQHGRHSSSNLSTVGSNISQPYPTTDPNGTALGIIYQDIQ